MSMPAPAKQDKIRCICQFLNGSGQEEEFTATKDGTHAEMAACKKFGADKSSLKLTVNAFPCEQCCQEFGKTADKGCYSSYYRTMKLLPQIRNNQNEVNNAQASVPWKHFPVHIFIYGGQIAKLSWYADAAIPPLDHYKGNESDCAGVPETTANPTYPIRFKYARVAIGRRPDSLELTQAELALVKYMNEYNYTEIKKTKANIKKLESDLQPIYKKLPTETWPLRKK